MRDEELSGLECIKISATGSHELDSAINLVSESFVLSISWVLSETLVPAVYFTQISKTTGSECTDQVQSGNCRVVTLDKTLGVCFSAFRSEVVAVDNVTTVSGESNVSTCFGVAGARLSKLPCHATHLDNRHFSGIGQYNCHL